MKTPSPWYPALGIVGMVAWMLFILGCIGWSSWSPDSSKVIFPCTDAGAHLMAIALYDRRTKIVSPIFVQSAETDKQLPLLQAQWATDGERIVVTVAEESDVDVFVSGVRLGVPSLQVHLGKVTEVYSPIPEIGGVLYVLQDKEILSVHLRTGNLRRNSSKGAPYEVLFAADSRLFYAKFTDDDKHALEIGAIDLADFHSSPLFQFKASDLKVQLLARPQVKGHRFAVVAQGVDTDSILIFNEKGLEQTLHPADLPNQFRIGNLQWSTDGRTLYSGMVTPSTKSWHYSLAEFSLDGKGSRVTPLFTIKDEDANGSGDTDDGQFLIDISLSPDGRTVATTPALFDPESMSEKDRALFLIDVRDPHRRVTRVPALKVAVPNVVPIGD